MRSSLPPFAARPDSRTSSVLAALMVVLSACSDGTAVAPPARITDGGVVTQGELILSPSSIKATEGDSVAISVSYQGHSTYNPSQLTWSVSPVEIGEVRDGYFVTAVPGEATVTARYSALTASASASVRPIPTDFIAMGSRTDLAIAGHALHDSVAVRVSGRGDLPVPDVSVQFSVEQGDGAVSHSSRLTDDDGITRVEWTLGALVGANTLRASVDGLGMLEFAVEGLADVETAELRVVDGDGQEGPVAELLQGPLVVQVVDAHGNPVRGIPLTWIFQDGLGGTGLGAFGAGAPMPSVTGADGRVAMQWQLGTTPGDQLASVTMPGALAAPGAMGAPGGGKKKDHDFGARARPGSVESLDITPGWVGLQSGDRLTLDVDAVDKFGNSVDADVNWTSSDGTIVAVDGQGQVTAVRTGTAVVSGKVGNKRDSTTVVVQGSGTPSMTPIQGADQVGTVGSTLPIVLSVRVTDEIGFVVEGQAVSWNVVTGGGSVSPTQGLTDAQGMAATTWTLGPTAGGQGVTVSGGGMDPVNFDASAQTGSVMRIEVAPSDVTLDPGGNVQFTASAWDVYDNALAGTQFVWSSSDEAVVTVNQLGTAVARLGGSAFVHATAGGVTGNASVEVSQPDQPTPDPAQITDLHVVTKDETSVTLRFSQVDDGTGQAADYALRYAEGSLSSSWGSAWDTEIAIPGTVVGALTERTVTDLEPGRAYEFGAVAIRAADATEGPLSNTAAITTDEYAVTSVTASPEGHTFTALEDTLELSATPRNAAGEVVTGLGLNWTSSHPLVAMVDGDGRVVAKGAGTAIITVAVACCGVSDAVSVVVDQLPSQVELDPPSLALEVGEEQYLSATVADANGYPVGGAGVNWSSADPTVVTVSDGGLATALGVGSTTVTAAAGGASATAHVSVSEGGAVPADPEQVTDLRVESTTASSVTLEFTEVDDGTGQPANYALRYGATPMSWGDAFATEVTVSGTSSGATASHTFDALQPDSDYEFKLVAYRGTLNVDAVFGPLSNLASATTGGGGSQGGVASVTASVQAHTFTTIGETFQLGAQAFDGAGSLVPGVTFTWQANDASIATVDDTGLLTAAGYGSTTVVVTAQGSAAADTISVSASPAPPPGAGQLVFSDDFSSGDLSKQNAYFRWGGTNWTGVKTHPVTGDPALRFNYNSVSDDATAEQRFVLKTPMKTVAFRWREYYATGAEGDNNANPLGYHHPVPSSGSNNNKYIRLWGDSYSSPDKVGASTRPIGSGDSEYLYTETTGAGGTGSTGNTVTPWMDMTNDRGTWREVRMLFTYASSPTAGDGVIRVWLNGVLVVDRNDLGNIYDPGSAVQAFQNGYLRGWANSGFRDHANGHRVRVWYDDFEVYQGDPGW